MSNRHAFWQHSRSQGFQHRGVVGQVGDLLSAPIVSKSQFCNHVINRQRLPRKDGTFVLRCPHLRQLLHQHRAPRFLFWSRVEIARAMTTGVYSSHHPCNKDSSDSCFIEAQNACALNVVGFSSVVFWDLNRWSRNAMTMTCSSRPSGVPVVPGDTVDLVGIVLKNKDQLKNVIRSVLKAPRGPRWRCWLVEGHGLLRGE